MLTPPTVSKCDVVLIAPELASESDPRVAQVIAMAARRVGFCDSQMQPVYKDAVTLLAAHLLTMFRRGKTGGAVGGVNRIKAGEVEQGFSSFLTRNAFQQTVYGAEYWLLVQSFVATGMVV